MKKKIWCILLKTAFVGSMLISLMLIGVNKPAADVFLTSGKVSNRLVWASGDCVGFYLESQGVVVIKIATLNNALGEEVCPAKNVLRPGDYILSINGIAVNSKEELIEQVGRSGKNPMRLVIRREQKVLTNTLTPVCCNDGEYKIGVWVRDDAQGIGTLTYIDEEGNFGALGHGISEQDTGKLLEIARGKLFPSKVWSIIKGSDGVPGSMAGVICYGEDLALGEITKNTENGVFGKIGTTMAQGLSSTELVEVAKKGQVHTGSAVLRCKIAGVISDFEIEILSVNHLDNSNKSMVLQITDKRLIEQTGGIVQGMSGSPILQDGRLVGAVTHVFIHDSTKGYGIFAETMLEWGY